MKVYLVYGSKGACRSVFIDHKKGFKSSVQYNVGRPWCKAGI